MHPHGNRPVEENSIPAMMEKFGVHSMDVIQSFRSSFPKLNGKSREGLYYCFQETFLMTLLKDLSSKGARTKEFSLSCSLELGITCMESILNFYHHEKCLLKLKLLVNLEKNRPFSNLVIDF